MKMICNHTNKVIYRSRSEALDIVLGFRARLKIKSERGIHIKRGVKKPKSLRSYYCEYCEGYHLTSWNWWPLGTKKYIDEQKKKSLYEAVCTL
ncbi:hypothetical protein U0035_14015 [Niabella yanshanensis]|uniref:Uncharacterized protein n=1 Tax=Niabella yanshanensis TaxID=577386 RepID=A0ABZ0W0K7_9BACT|nr:hypothetical protein [Niabella yanshanensis]WQD36783.1 hypothetical protein U0035_14015 [Niabella yanshanensis]